MLAFTLPPSFLSSGTGDCAHLFMHGRISRSFFTSDVVLQGLRRSLALR